MTASPSTRPDRPLIGIALVLFAVLGFALSDVITKYLASRHPVPVVVAIRYLVNIGLLVVFLAPRMGRRLWATDRTGLVIVRALCLACASLTLGYALKFMPVGETIAIMYLSPFLVMLLAGPVLGETVSPAAWIGASVGFLGVLLILRPGSGLDPLGVGLAVLNAGIATAYAMLTRALSRTETTLAMLFYVGLIGAISFVILALPFWRDFALGWSDFGLALLLGALATLGHFLFTAAYREAPASMLGPVNYLHLVWAAGLGWLVFDHVPTGLTMIGIALVAGSGAAVAYRAHLVRRAALTGASAALPG